MAQASAAKLYHTRPAGKEKMASVPQESSWQVCQSRLSQKEKEQSHMSRPSDCEVGESRGERELHLGERDQSGRIEKKWLTLQ